MVMVAKKRRRAWTLGSLCTGISGLDLAAEDVYGCKPIWCSEIEAGPLTIIERHWPGLPNLGNIKTVDWATVPRVDVLTAGYPCQPFSHAGKRLGDQDERHLWPYVAQAIRELRPRRVVLENVRGHVSKGLDAVVKDLAEAGFDAEWCVLRASDVGACHQRARVFIVAAHDDQSPTDTEGSERRGSQQQDVGASVGSASEPRKCPSEVAWGQYEPAIRRWERVLGRAAPAPTDNAGRLNPVFVEWMQGYPEGWVDGLTRTQALKALGNSVVRQQARVAIGLLEDALHQPVMPVRKVRRA